MFDFKIFNLAKVCAKNVNEFVKSKNLAVKFLVFRCGVADCMFDGAGSDEFTTADCWKESASYYDQFLDCIEECDKITDFYRAGYDAMTEDFTYWGD